MIKRETIEFNQKPFSLNWKDETLVDWVDGGSQFSLNGVYKHSGRGYSYRFDSAIQSDNGVYSVVYEKLGTKALILKNGEILRELNRSYYCANSYEYPIQFLKIENKYAIVHCPQEYNLIQIEYVESGDLVTKIENRNADDCFHSRFRINQSNSLLLNTGWVWHPYGIIELYNIAEGLNDNSIFDRVTYDFPTVGEVSSAEFLNDDVIVVSASNEPAINDENIHNIEFLQPNEIGLFSIKKNKFLKKVKVDFKLGTLIPIDTNYAIDLFGCPKLIELNTGEIVQRFEDINSGKQNLAITGSRDEVPPIAIDTKLKRIAIANDNKIELLKFQKSVYNTA